MSSRGREGAPGVARWVGAAPVEELQALRDGRRHELGLGDGFEGHAVCAIGIHASQLRATSSASRVLPVPPGPVSVSSRLSPSNASTSPPPASRPTKVVSDGGRSPAPTDPRRGGKSVGRPVDDQQRQPLGGLEVLEGCSPRSSQDSPSAARLADETPGSPPTRRPGRRGRGPDTRRAVDVETHEAAAHGLRLARSGCPSGPRTCSSPARARTPGHAGRGRRGHRIPGARKVTKNESPSVPCSCRRGRERHHAGASRWRSRTTRVRDGADRCSSRVEPSMSVNRNVRRVGAPTGHHGDRQRPDRSSAASPRHRAAALRVNRGRRNRVRARRPPNPVAASMSSRSKGHARGEQCEAAPPDDGHREQHADGQQPAPIAAGPPRR